MVSCSMLIVIGKDNHIKYNPSDNVVTDSVSIDVLDRSKKEEREHHTKETK